ncbi:hypothetical protein LQF12_15920 [Ruania suaedae]|nr:hypothetical protein [Ruania suaedae]UFU02948.1 hypothetical protein LQF12_15920 [Ruania suaedae]
MSAPTRVSSAAFTPIVRVLPPLGTNGHISTWGAELAGTAPPAVAD